MPKDGKTAAIIALILATLYFWRKKPPPIPPPICTPGETECVGYDLYRCSLEGEWVLDEENSPNCGYTPPVITTLSGYVTDKAGIGLEGARIILDSQQIYSEPDGWYNFGTIVPGTYTLRCILSNYTSYEESITVLNEMEFNIVLSPFIPVPGELSCESVAVKPSFILVGEEVTISAKLYLDGPAGTFTVTCFVNGTQWDVTYDYPYPDSRYEVLIGHYTPTRAGIHTATIQGISATFEAKEPVVAELHCPWCGYAVPSDAALVEHMHDHARAYFQPVTFCMDCPYCAFSIPREYQEPFSDEKAFLMIDHIKTKHPGALKTV